MAVKHLVCSGTARSRHNCALGWRAGECRPSFKKLRNGGVLKLKRENEKFISLFLRRVIMLLIRLALFARKHTDTDAHIRFSPRLVQRQEAFSRTIAFPGKPLCRTAEAEWAARRTKAASARMTRSVGLSNQSKGQICLSDLWCAEL